MRRGTFVIIVGLILAAIGGATLGGRLGSQELLVILGVLLAWAFGVSLFRGALRLKRRLSPPRPKDER